MTLSENNTHYKRKKTVMYAKDDTTAVIRHQDLQFIGLNLWRGRTKGDEARTYCRLYAFYESLDLGLDISNLNDPDEQEVDALLSAYQSKFGFITPDDVIRRMDSWAEQDAHIPNTYIMLAGYICPEKAMVYRTAKAAKQVARAKKEAEQKEQQAKVDSEFCAEMNARAAVAVNEAKLTMRSGGSVQNTKISIYRSRYDFSEYNLFNYLANQFGVKIPLRVQGWIVKSLTKVEIGNDGPTRLFYYGGKSKTIFTYMRALVAAIRAEEDGQSASSVVR